MGVLVDSSSGKGAVLARVVRGMLRPDEEGVVEDLADRRWREAEEDSVDASLSAVERDRA